MSGEAHTVAVGWAVDNHDLITIHAGDTYAYLSRVEAKRLAERLLAMVDIFAPRDPYANIATGHPASSEVTA